MTRNKNPFTDRQLRLLEAIRAKIQEITDPDADVIRPETVKFYSSQTKKYGKIIKIKFPPRSVAIKAELSEAAGLFNSARREKLKEIRKKYYIKPAAHADARLFEEEFNQISFKLKKAMFITGLTNFLLTTGDSPLAEPCRLTQEIIMSEYPNITEKRAPLPAEDPAPKQGKTYEEELMEVK